jgi:2-succinyl-5-enolpyruvyl-6-hydroxy-3-cyclohexene-1-carboxylate synthase
LAKTSGRLELNLAVINNGGGRIFHRMFKNALFENRHDLGFQAWAGMWGWDYLRLDHPVLELAPAARPRILEIIPDEAQTENFWRAYERRP